MRSRNRLRLNVTARWPIGYSRKGWWNVLTVADECTEEAFSILRRSVTRGFQTNPLWPPVPADEAENSWLGKKNIKGKEDLQIPLHSTH